MADSEKTCAYRTIRNNEFGSTKTKSNCDLRGNKDRHHCQTETLSSLGQTFCDILPNNPELQRLLKNLNEKLTQECCKATCGEQLKHNIHIHQGLGKILLDVNGEIIEG